MDKKSRIWGVRSGMIGDMVMALPMLNFLESQLPKSYKYWVVGKRFSQAACLFLNHPLIDRIHVLESPEKLETQRDFNIALSCDIVYNVTPEHPDGTPGINCFWWNKYNCVEETWRMTGTDISFYHQMPPEFKKPKLEKWFPIEKYDKTIAVWCMAGYGNEPKRSPSKTWWEGLLKRLLSDNWNIIRLGHPKEPDFFEYPTYNNHLFKDLRKLSFFEQIQISLGCNLCINTDSGSGWVIGAYGHNQISLITNHSPNHTQNLLAFAPENCYNNNINLLNSESCDKIRYEDILDNIKKFYE